MTRRPLTTETRIVLQTILSAGVLAVLLVLACTGMGAGGRWVVDDDGDASVNLTYARNMDIGAFARASRCAGLCAGVFH
ncbi:MAG: hypothetical protein CHKLHMKO_00148 [Candidatus Argoarchaeum ethanivorans]|uniref:Uncharacterized protein n=1 Tax=Candidatus Argoarchaeum ethanivorans TaxID=2608793 RepID=A0A811T9S2_9EURY|nr:MAG: hypothetical protein CHKLHMKO_00148 [Candidatus Argoarchaeum ethanivorans]